MRRMYSKNELRNETLDLLSKESVRIKSLNLDEPYKSFDLTPVELSGRTLTVRYNKVIVSSGILFIIVNYVLKNETEETLPQANIVFSFDVPSEIGDKIICFNGEKVSDNFTSGQQIASFEVVYGQYLTNQANRGISKTAKNKIAITLLCPQQNAGVSEQFTGRQWLALF